MQTAAYRFGSCVLNEEMLSCHEVMRHRGNTPRCMNPDHLDVGTRGENRHDDRLFEARGAEHRWL